MELSDNVIASSNSQMALNLFILGHLKCNDTWIDHASGMVTYVRKEIEANPKYYSNWAILLTHILHSPYEVSIVGQNWKTFHEALTGLFLPSVIFSGGESEGSLEILQGKRVDQKTLIYVCRDKVCQLPVDNVKSALLLIRSHPAWG
jgi:hypothetical protein